MKMFKKISVSTALSATLMSTVLISSPVQAADKWQTISPSDCRISLTDPATPAAIDDAAAVRDTDYVSNASGEITSIPSGATNLVVDCSIPRSTIDADVLKVYAHVINGGVAPAIPLASATGPTNDPIICTLRTTAFDGDAVGANVRSASDFSDVLGFSSGYTEAQAYGWGAANMRCVFPTAFIGTLKSINYK